MRHHWVFFNYNPREFLSDKNRNNNIWNENDFLVSFFIIFIFENKTWDENQQNYIKPKNPHTYKWRQWPFLCICVLRRIYHIHTRKFKKHTQYDIFFSSYLIFILVDVYFYFDCGGIRRLRIQRFYFIFIFEEKTDLIYKKKNFNKIRLFWLIFWLKIKTISNVIHSSWFQHAKNW